VKSQDIQLLAANKIVMIKMEAPKLLMEKSEVADMGANKARLMDGKRQNGDITPGFEASGSSILQFRCDPRS